MTKRSELSEYVTRLRAIREDSQQRTVIDNDISRVVIAGPGSGKTYLLTTKAAKILFSGIVRVPQRILCLTYSRFLENQLRQDLSRLLFLDPDCIFVGTVHSFCISEVIFPFSSLYKLEIPDPFRLASWDEMHEAVRICLSKQGLRPSVNSKQISDLLRDLGKFRRLRIDSRASTFSECSDYGRSLSPNLDWFKLAADYTEVLANGELNAPSLDFVQIEIDSLKLIEEHKLVQRSLAARFPWWFIDEYQDLGRPFHQMIQCLLESTAINVLAIGDPDQCIYEQIQGSKPEYVTELAEYIGNKQGSELITLKTNYRSSQEIIDFSEIMLGEQRGYRSGLGMQGLCCSIQLSNRKYRISEVQRRLLQRLLTHLTKAENGPGLDECDIAILYPYRDGLNRIELQLTSADWPCALDKHPEYNRSLELIEWTENLAKCCVSGFVGPYFSLLLPKWKELNLLSSLSSEDEFGFQEEKLLFEALWDLQDPNMKLSDWLFKVVERLRLIELVEQYGIVRPDESIEFSRLITAVNSDPGLSNWTLDRFAETGNRIQLTTLYSSKGSQYEAVIIGGFDELVYWGRSQPIPLDHRLAYVASTRAKRFLYLIHQRRDAYFVNEMNQKAQDSVQFFSYDGENVARITYN